MFFEVVTLRELYQVDLEKALEQILSNISILLKIFQKMLDKLAAICYNYSRQEKNPLKTVAAVFGGFPHTDPILFILIIPEIWGFVNVGLYF